MFLVLSTPNGKNDCRDADKINKVSPRFITDNPSEALLEAREAQNDLLSDYVKDVFIYELEKNQRYNIHDSAPEVGNNKFIVYVAWRTASDSAWRETFFNSWKTMVKFANVLASN